MFLHGRVRQLPYPLSDGKVMLLAVTGGLHPCILDHVECEESEIPTESARLYEELAEHHRFKRPAFAAAASQAARRAIRLVASSVAFVHVLPL